MINTIDCKNHYINSDTVKSRRIILHINMYWNNLVLLFPFKDSSLPFIMKVMSPLAIFLCLPPISSLNIIFFLPEPNAPPHSSSQIFFIALRMFFAERRNCIQSKNSPTTLLAAIIPASLRQTIIIYSSPRLLIASLLARIICCATKSQMHIMSFRFRIIKTSIHVSSSNEKYTSNIKKRFIYSK